MYPKFPTESMHWFADLSCRKCNSGDFPEGSGVAKGYGIPRPLAERIGVCLEAVGPTDLISKGLYNPEQLSIRGVGLSVRLHADAGILLDQEAVIVHDQIGAW